MKFLILMLMSLSFLNPKTVFDFTREANIAGWRVIDDVVMGGRSSGSFALSDEGHGVFEGHVSLENNGGFSSVRYGIPKMVVGATDVLQIWLKGDGKTYQVRIKDRSDRYYSYIKPFSTSGAWELVEVQLSEMVPSYRGRQLDQPNFDHQQIEEIAFLIGNKKPEDFRLVLDKIAIRSNN